MRSLVYGVVRLCRMASGSRRAAGLLMIFGGIGGASRRPPMAHIAWAFGPTRTGRPGAPSTHRPGRGDHLRKVQSSGSASASASIANPAESLAAHSLVPPGMLAPLTVKGDGRNSGFRAR